MAHYAQLGGKPPIIIVSEAYDSNQSIHVLYLHKYVQKHTHKHTKVYISTKTLGSKVCIEYLFITLPMQTKWKKSHQDKQWVCDFSLTFIRNRHIQLVLFADK